MKRLSIATLAALVLWILGSFHSVLAQIPAALNAGAMGPQAAAQSPDLSAAPIAGTGLRQAGNSGRVPKPPNDLTPITSDRILTKLAPSQSSSLTFGPTPDGVALKPLSTLPTLPGLSRTIAPIHISLRAMASSEGVSSVTRKQSPLSPSPAWGKLPAYTTPVYSLMMKHQIGKQPLTSEHGLSQRERLKTTRGAVIDSLLGNPSQP